MKNTFGTSVAVTLFGESHGSAVGAVLDGMAPGVRVDADFIAHQLTLRRPYGAISTQRVEPDRFEIVSGVYGGRTTGTPLCVLIPNEDARSADYALPGTPARPGHADYTGYVKYHGFADPRGGGHFSGRVTAALTAVGAVAITALREKGVLIGTHVARCGGVSDRDFSDGDLPGELAALNELRFAVLDAAAGERMRDAIEAAAADGDSVGGILETAVCGLPAGVGEPWFDTLEGTLAHALFSIPGVKGVDFGGAFDRVDARGSAYNDPFYVENGAVRTKTNHSGGVNGGVSNGMPLLFRCAVKPTSSIAKAQETVELQRMQPAVLTLGGRHDPAFLHRARVVADSVTALALCDALALRFGTDWLGGAPCAAD